MLYSSTVECDVDITNVRRAAWSSVLHQPSKLDSALQTRQSSEVAELQVERRVSSSPIYK